MRKLKTTDVFTALRIIKKANIREELKPVMLSVAEKVANGTADVSDIGLDGVLAVLEALSEKGAEQGIYEFLAGPFECTPKKVADMELALLIKNLQELAEENDLASFFHSLSGMTTTR